MLVVLLPLYLAVLSRLISYFYECVLLHVGIIILDLHKNTKNLSLFQSVRIDPGAHLISYSMNNRFHTLRAKLAGQEADHSIAASTQVKNTWKLLAPSHVYSEQDIFILTI